MAVVNARCLYNCRLCDVEAQGVCLASLVLVPVESESCRLQRLMFQKAQACARSLAAVFVLLAVKCVSGFLLDYVADFTDT